jgi:peptide deformylase
MAAEGIVQRGAQILVVPARQFRFPDEAADAAGVVDRLVEAADRVVRRHDFSNGMGLAAPQIGVDRAASLVRPRGDAEPFVLFNPRVVAQSPDEDMLYEGCLSFFDVRGMVPRPRWLEVEHTTPDGAVVRTAFDMGLARLVVHEVDHLHGVLYVDRMRDGYELVPEPEYRKQRSPWYSGGSPA